MYLNTENYLKVKNSFRDHFHGPLLVITFSDSSSFTTVIPIGVFFFFCLPETLNNNYSYCCN